MSDKEKDAIESVECVMSTEGFEEDIPVILEIVRQRDVFKRALEAIVDIFPEDKRSLMFHDDFYDGQDALEACHIAVGALKETSDVAKTTEKLGSKLHEPSES